MKYSRRPHGFTLVEALIVSVIVAIIGIAAVVTYSGYVRESRRQAVEGIAEAAAVAANAYVRKVGNDNNLHFDSLHLFITNPNEITGVINPANTQLNPPNGTVTVTYTKNNTTIIVSKPY